MPRTHARALLDDHPFVSQFIAKPLERLSVIKDQKRKKKKNGWMTTISHTLLG